MRRWRRGRATGGAGGCGSQGSACRQTKGCSRGTGRPAGVGVSGGWGRWVEGFQVWSRCGGRGSGGWAAADRPLPRLQAARVSRPACRLQPGLAGQERAAPHPRGGGRPQPAPHLGPLGGVAQRDGEADLHGIDGALRDEDAAWGSGVEVGGGVWNSGAGTGARAPASSARETLRQARRIQRAEACAARSPPPPWLDAGRPARRPPPTRREAADHGAKALADARDAAGVAASGLHRGKGVQHGVPGGGRGVGSGP
jgi:hypothetical protein